VHVLVAHEVAQEHLVQARECDLARVRVAREHERHTKLPQAVGFFGDVRHAEGGQVVAQALGGERRIGMARVRVVEPHHLQLLIAQRDGGVRVVQHLHAGAPQRLAYGIRARPVVVVAERADHGRLQLAQTLLELIQVLLAVAHEIARDDHQVGALRVGDVDGGLLRAVRRDPPEVLVGEVRDTHVGQPLFVLHVAGKAAQLDLGALFGHGHGQLRKARLHGTGRLAFHLGELHPLPRASIDTARRTGTDSALPVDPSTAGRDPDRAFRGAHTGCGDSVCNCTV
jgi:hypothetical protein